MSGSRIRQSSMASAPLVAKTADYYLRKKHGIPTDSIQTYLDYVQHGRWPSWYRQRFGRTGG